MYRGVLIWFHWYPHLRRLGSTVLIQAGEIDNSKSHVENESSNPITLTVLFINK